MGMTYKGRVQNGVIVLPPEVQLPDGIEVTVETSNAGGGTDPLITAARQVAKSRPHWPDDYVLNHGYYVSGEPKKP